MASFPPMIGGFRNRTTLLPSPPPHFSFLREGLPSVKSAEPMMMKMGALVLSFDRVSDVVSFYVPMDVSFRLFLFFLIFSPFCSCITALEERERETERDLLSFQSIRFNNTQRSSVCRRSLPFNHFHSFPSASCFPSLAGLSKSDGDINIIYHPPPIEPSLRADRLSHSSFPLDNPSIPRSFFSLFDRSIQHYSVPSIPEQQGQIKEGKRNHLISPRCSPPSNS